jgi:hypothetical protein
MGMEIILLVAIVVAVVVGLKVKEKSNQGEQAPAPSIARTDLLYGYYGSDSKQLDETKDHINVHMTVGWSGPANQLEETIKAASIGIPVILALPEVYQETPNVDAPFDLQASESRVRNRFQELKTAGVLSNIAALYPIDEPDLKNVYSAETIQTANTMIRRVMADFGVNIPLAVIYTTKWQWPGVDSYDWVGFDNYDAGGEIFTNGDYQKLKKVLRPDQKIILVPGGCDKWRNDPTPFFNMAQADQQVKLLMPFIWIDNSDPVNGANAGIRSNPMTLTYKTVGTKIKTAAL